MPYTGDNGSIGGRTSFNHAKSAGSGSAFLICHVGALGDFILTWPALLGVRRQLPDLRLLGVGRPVYMQLAAHFGLIDRRVDMDSRDMPDLFAGRKIPVNLGRVNGGIFWLKNAAGPVKLVRSVSSLPVIPIDPFSSAGTHVAYYYTSILQRYLSIEFPADLIELIPPAKLRQASLRTALIHPGSGSKQKNFPPHFYQTIKTMLNRHGFEKVWFIAGPAEQDWHAENLSTEEIIHPATVLDLVETLSTAGLYIGNDSGVSHLAGFLGVPSLVFYRATDPAIWGVLGRNVNYISAGDENSALERVKKYLQNINRFNAGYSVD